MIPGSVLQQELGDQLRAASIVVSRVQSAGLVAAIDCQPATANRLSAQQCLSLLQAVSDSSAANGLHLTTTWRNCQTYKCGKQTCGQLASTTQSNLVGQFIPAFRALIAKNETAAPQPAAELQPMEASLSPVVYAPASKPGLKPWVVFFSAYILICLAVLTRWAVSQSVRV